MMRLFDRNELVCRLVPIPTSMHCDNGMGVVVGRGREGSV